MNFAGHVILGPLTKGGNLPFRRLCVEFGARVTMSEMAYARQVVRRSKSELALLRKHDSEACFGVQLAANKPEEAIKAGAVAVERGASFVDVNVGCPIHDVVRRGMGATLLSRPAALARLVEALVGALPVPITVKIRSGWTEAKINALEIGRCVVDAGAAALTLHARSREQRYSKAADWDLIAQLVAALPIPVIGNGDLLTHYETRERWRASGCASVMLARGALIKPWLFREIEDDRAWEPTAEERLALYRRFAVYLKQHFRDDDKGRERAMRFLPWHLDFFCRYRPLPEAQWSERSRAHPLMQTRYDEPPDLPVLETLLRDPRPALHERLAALLWESADDAELLERVTALAGEMPPAAGEAGEVLTAHG